MGELQKKMSVLMLQMSSFYHKALREPIQKIGFGEFVKPDDVDREFPQNIMTVEKNSFGLLKESIDDTMAVCKATEQRKKLMGILNHEGLAQFCTILEKNYKFDTDLIAKELHETVQNKVNLFREWVSKTKKSFDEIQQWLQVEPNSNEGNNEFEPVGFPEIFKGFSNTKFYQDYLKHWDGKTGAFTKAYHAMMDSLQEKGEHQQNMAIAANKAQNDFHAAQEHNKQIVMHISKLAIKMAHTKAKKKLQKQLFQAYMEELKE